MPIAVNKLFNRLTAAGLLVLLQACASAPNETASAGEAEADPELTLNLPQQAVPCAAESGADDTFFDRGFSSLVAGDHVEAVTYFQRYQRTESSAVANWQAQIAIAYDSMLPQSPFYDPDGARKAYRRLKQEQPQEGVFSEKALMMREALAAFDAMERHIADLKSDNATLAADLEKREEALRRLRELTLGQGGAAP